MGTEERNIFIKIAYDGTDFSGWQRQPGRRTVCGELEEVMSRVLGAPVSLSGASRTDAGVHACGQTASFTGIYGIPTERIPKAVNDALARDRLERVSDVEILSAEEKPEGFHARFSSTGKRYIYRISNAPKTDVFKHRSHFQVTRPLDVSLMREAAEYIKGEHDFACFQSAGGTPRETTVRNVYRLDVLEKGGFGTGGSLIDIVIEGNGFLYNMVRIISGTLAEAGLGKRTPESVLQAIEAKDRSLAGFVAPPQGLYLDEVFYQE